MTFVAIALATLCAAFMLGVLWTFDKLDTARDETRKLKRALAKLREAHAVTSAALCIVRTERDDARHQLDALGGLRERSRESVRWN